MALYWLADPRRRTVTVFRPDGSEEVFGEGDELTGEDVLPDLKLRVADFFLLPGERASDE